MMVKGLKVFIIFSCLAWLSSCQKSDGPTTEETLRKRSEEAVDLPFSSQHSHFQSSSDSALPLESFRGESLLPSKYVPNPAILRTPKGEFRVFVASLKATPLKESLYIVFHPIEEESISQDETEESEFLDDKVYLVLEDLSAGSIQDLHFYEDETGSYILFTKESELFYLNFEYNLGTDENMDDEGEDYMVSAKPIVSHLPQIIKFSQDEGLSDVVDITITGLSEVELFPTLVQIFSEADCQGLELYTEMIEFLEENSDSSYLLKNVPTLEGVHHYSIKRTVGGISHCSESSKEYKKLSYNGDLSFLEVKDHPFTQVEVLIPKIEATNISLTYALEVMGKTYHVPSNFKVLLTDLLPSTTYQIRVLICEEENPKACLRSDLFSYTTSVFNPSYFSKPILRLKRDATAALHSSHAGFAKELYAEVLNTQAGVTYSFYKDACEGIPIKTFSDFTSVAFLPLEENKKNTFYVKASFDGESRCSEGVSYTHLGGLSSLKLSAKEIGLQEMTLFWDHFDGVQSYVLKVDNKIVAYLKTNSYLLTDLKPETSYLIELYAEDFDSFSSSPTEKVHLKTEDYLSPRMRVLPPKSLSPISYDLIYVTGVATIVDLEVTFPHVSMSDLLPSSSLGVKVSSSEDVHLYQGEDCFGIPLFSLQKSKEDSKVIFTSVKASTGPWSVKRVLKGVSRCSDLSSYDQIFYSKENTPQIQIVDKRSVKATLRKVSKKDEGPTFYQISYKALSESGQQEKASEWKTLHEATGIITGLSPGTAYTFTSRICDYYGMCSEESKPSEKILTYINPCASLKGGDYVYILSLSDDLSALPQEVRERAEHFSSVDESGFCLMKYDAKQVNGMPYSQKDLLPWTRIKQEEAKSACESLGEGYRLMTNAEWMTVALNIEAQEKNWNEEKTKMNKGISSDISSFDGEFACIEDAMPCSLDYRGWHENRRTFFISNDLDYPDNLIWDFAGNVYNWIIWDKETDVLKGDESPGKTSGYSDIGFHISNGKRVDVQEILSQKAYTTILAPGLLTRANYGQYVKNILLDDAAPKRGGAYRSGTVTGVFSLSLYRNGEEMGSDVGFRCMKEL